MMRSAAASLTYRSLAVALLAMSAALASTACERPINKDAHAPREEPAPPPPPAASSAPATIGAGKLEEPAQGPAPFDGRHLAGKPFTLVKNWDFGSGGTIRNNQDLIAEFEFHDQFGTIANGAHYGAVMVAPTPAEAIHISGDLGLPDNLQPVEDPKRPNREWTRDVLKAHVLPLSAAQASASTKAHDAGCGSFVAKWRLPTGGSHLGKDLLWETRVRMPTPKPGYWYAVWTAGSKWDQGAEMDVLEAFGAPHLMEAKVFHVNSVGGDDKVDFKDWFSALKAVGVPETNWDLTRFHVWSWLYKQDDSYSVFYDGRLVQHGTIHWTLGAKPDAAPIDMAFLFDFTWGHTEAGDVNVSLPASAFPITYEIDYSRVYLRDNF